MAWNLTWAEICGFNFDNTKMRAAYVDYEQRQGATPEALARLPGSYDKAKGLMHVLSAGHADQCTDDRLARLRETMARYLAGDFSPTSAV